MLFRGKKGYRHQGLESKALAYSKDRAQAVEEYKSLRHKVASDRPAVREAAAVRLRSSLQVMEEVDKLLIKMQNYYFGMVRRPGGIMLQPWVELYNAAGDPINCVIFPDYMRGIGKAAFQGRAPMHPLWDKEKKGEARKEWDKNHVLNSAVQLEQYLVAMRAKMSKRIVVFMHNMEVMRTNHEYIAKGPDSKKRRHDFIMQVDGYYTKANKFDWYYNDNQGIMVDTREELLQRTGSYADKQLIVAESLDYFNHAPASDAANYWLNVMGELQSVYRSHRFIANGLTYDIRTAVSRRLPNMSIFNDDKPTPLIHEYAQGIVLYNGASSIRTHNVDRVKMDELLPRMRNRSVTVRVPQNRIHVYTSKVKDHRYGGTERGVAAWRHGRDSTMSLYRKLFPRKRPKIST